MRRNPYAPPTAKVEDVDVPIDPGAPRKRPVPAWTICIRIWPWRLQEKGVLR